ncbi:Uncharacterised protein [Pseudomonas aeruginosa]|nr:Uncharacterised protein [Pseudomonas aeruginosa]
MFARSLCGSLLLFVSLAGLAAENPPDARALPCRPTTASCARRRRSSSN